MQNRAEQKRFLDENLDIYLKPMCQELLLARPEKVLDFLINWLQTKGREIEVQRNHIGD